MSHRILIVEDYVDSADVLAEFLRMNGHEVQVAYDASRALELAPMMRPDVVVLDIGLPEMDGYAVAALLREQFAPLRLVALTGYSHEIDRQRAIAAGFDHHMVKPVDVAALLDMVA